MSMKLRLVAALGLPMLAVSLGVNLAQCQQAGSSSATADEEKCCPSGDGCCQQTNTETLMRVQGNDLGKQIVFKVDGLQCPAVKGIGCGHMLFPVLSSLDKTNGVEASSTNYTGTMIRVSVNSATERAKVADAVRKSLAGKKPVALEGDDLKTALANEQWREAWRVGELSAIEFHTLGRYWINRQAKAEGFSKKTTEKLMKIAEEEWERCAHEAMKDKATRPEDWGNRFKKSIPVLLARAKEALSDKQFEQFKNAVMTPCRDREPPDAPPAASPKMACSLTPDQLMAQRKELLPGLFQRAEKVEDIPNGLRLRFAHQRGLVTEIAAVIEKEQVCCGFLSFRLVTDTGDGPITLEVSGPPGTAEMLRKLQTVGYGDR